MARSAAIDRSPPRAARAGLGLALAFVGLLVGCSLFDTEPDDPPEKWQEDKWGPVVPHETFPADCKLCHVTGSWSELGDE